MDAFAAFLRYDAPGAGRRLSRLGTPVLAGRLLPAAARALAEAIDVVLAAEPPAGSRPTATAHRPRCASMAATARSGPWPGPELSGG
jgi:hypothetical protein